MAQRLIVLLLLLVARSVHGESLPDPTRPPMATLQEGTAAPTTNTPRLQMIKISPSRRSAIVDGQEVTIGSTVGEARVVKIAEGEVVLRGKAGTETLKLFSEVEKRPVIPQTQAHPVKKRGAAAKKKTDEPNSSRKAR